MKNKERLIGARVNEINGTSFVGYLNGTFKELVERFGEPHRCDIEGPWRSRDKKVRVQWAFKMGTGDDRLVFTIYDYKEKRSLGRIYTWHIGAKGNRGRLLEVFSLDAVVLNRVTHK